MSRKDKSGQKIVLVKNRGGRSRTADLSIDPDEARPRTELSALAEHVTAECYQLTVEFEWVFQQLGLRKVELDSFLNEINRCITDRSVAETQLMKCFKGAVLGPLRDLCQKLTQLHGESAQSEQSQLRAVLRSAASVDESNFDKMLHAFEQKVEAAIKLSREDTEARHEAAMVLEATNRCAARGKQIKQSITGQKLEGGKHQLGLEQELDELVRQTARELVDDKSPLHTKDKLENRWEKFEQLLKSYREAKKDFVATREEYNASARMFFIEHDSLGQYRGDRHRQQDTIRYANEFFTAAGLDPFELSDKLAGIDRKQVLAMPGVEERVTLESTIPDPFPQLQESRVEERVQNTVKEVVEAIANFDKPPPKPPETCPVTLLELALCTYAAFVARYPNGKPYPTSGRTTRKVYEAMLVPAQLTYGCTQEQFKEAVKEAEGKGWMKCFKRKAGGGKAWYMCYQPTATGYTQVDALYAMLPSDFCRSIFARHEALREEAAKFRQELREKKQQTPQ